MFPKGYILHFFRLGDTYLYVQKTPICLSGRYCFCLGIYGCRVREILMKCF